MTTSAILHASLSDLDLVRLRSMEPHDAAVALDGRLRALEAVYRQGFIHRGLILLEVQERQLWRWLDEDGRQYRSFEDYVVNACPHSRRDCFAALSAVKELKDVPLAQLAEVPRCNVEVLKTLSTSVRNDPTVLRDAATMTENEFTAKVSVNHPNQHIEAPVRPTLRLTPAVQSALDLIGSLMSIEDRQGQLEAMAIDFVVEHQQ